MSCQNTTFICENGGTCVDHPVDEIFNFKCLCSSGFTGELCEKSKSINNQIFRHSLKIFKTI
jgi:hypothetical protein